MKEVSRIVMFGPPGAGKGTQSKALSEWLGVPHISTGQVLREEMSNSTRVGILAKEFMERGELVSDNVLIEMIKNLLESEACSSGWILDGFPRTLSQARFLDKLLEDISQRIDSVISLRVPENVLVHRLLKRSSLEGRADDNEEAIANRLRVYEEQTSPILDYYGSQKFSVTIDGDQVLSEVTSDIRKALEQLSS